MLVVDADTHIQTEKTDANSIGVDELLRRMDKAEVEKALVWLQPPYDRDISRENRGVYEAVRTHPDRLIGFGWVNPRLGVKHAKEEIRRCLEDYGFVGVKFNGAQDDYRIDAPEVLELVSLVIERGGAVAFHVGADSPENTHPYRFGRVVRQFPEGRFLMVHMGGAGFPPLSRAAIEVATELKNVWLVGSAVPETAVLEALHSLGPQRVCFGSDTPFFLMHVQVAKYKALLKDFPRDVASNVMGGNVLRALNLK